MEKVTEVTNAGTKSSNEILSELFGAFNIEPPTIAEKLKSSATEDEESDRKSRKIVKKRKSKKKHKSKSKKNKKKHSHSDSDVGSVEGMSATKKRKKKSREKKSKKQEVPPSSVNIELPVNQVPMALEIMLDGTVGIKGEDGSITEIPDIPPEPLKSSNETSTVNGEVSDQQEPVLSPASESKDKTEKPAMKIPEVFEAEHVDQGEKQKKGKIQIRDLKFSSVFQETVKAVEEKQKKEQERKADIEEGELSDSSETEMHTDCDDPMTYERHKRKFSVIERRYWSHSKTYSKNEDLRIYLKKRKKSKSRHRTVSRSRSRSPRSRSRSRSKHRSRSRYHSYDKHSFMRRRSRSKSRDHHSSHYDSYRKRSSSSRKTPRSRTRDKRRSSSRSRRSRDRKDKVHSSHRSKSKEAKDRSKTKSKERSESVEKIDKEKLLAIARKNALKLIDAGVVPGGEKMTTIKAGGKTVNELTEYCKKLSKKEALGNDVSDVDSESSDEGEKPFHHPFQVRDRPNSIIMNIKNSIPLPVKTLQEKAAEQSKQLRLQFPVSSGSSHRRTESEWIPVSPKKDDVPDKQLVLQSGAMPAPQPFVPPLPIDNVPKPQMQAVSLQPIRFSAVPPPEPFNRPQFPVIQPSPPASKLDISTIVSKRLEAMRKLQENPNDSQALTQMYNAQQEMQYWAESKQESGAFTGTTGAKVLSASELSSGAHAWAKRDQLTSATPVKSGMGMALLQKMGWQPGEGLGKNKEGTLEPLRLEVKMDKKGLVASDESRKGGKKGPVMQQGPALPTVKTLDGKHPVSLLNELCSRRRYGMPQFELCFECGPDHKKNFLFKVKVNGMEYTPSVASPNKKQAKAEAAAICLRALGAISKL